MITNFLTVLTLLAKFDDKGFPISMDDGNILRIGRDYLFTSDGGDDDDDFDLRNKLYPMVADSVMFLFSINFM